MRRVLIALLLCATGMAKSFALDFSVGHLKYHTLTTSTVRVDGLATGVTPSGTLVIPSSVTYDGVTYTVTTIKTGAFAGTYGGSTAMGYTALELPNTLTLIGSNAFYQITSLEGELVIPNSVTKIDQRAFYQCSGFTSLTLGTGLTEIASMAFYECTGFQGTLVLPSSLVTLGQNSFVGCTGFTGNLVIPGSVSSIGQSAFKNCSGFNGTLTIENGVQTIGRNAFSHDADKPSAYLRFVGDLVIPNSVTSIAGNAFDDCMNFNGTLTLSENLTTLGGYAFRNCNFHGDLTLPEGLTSLDSYSFYGCNSFDGALTIPSTMTKISRDVFAGCKNFRSVRVHATTPPTMNFGQVFDNMILNNKPIYVPCESKEAYMSDTYWGAFQNYQDSPWELFVQAEDPTMGYCTIEKHGECDDLLSIILATPSDNVHDFVCWLVDGEEVSTNRIHCFDLDSDITMVARFEPVSVSKDFTFRGTNNANWSDLSNWENQPSVLPGANDRVVINGICQLNQSANVASLAVNYQKTMTVNAESVLTTPQIHTYIYTTCDYFVIADGGQVVHDNNGVLATMEKNIEGYADVNQKTGYYMLAAPFHEDISASSLMTGVFDLYTYHEPTHYWWNAEGDEHGFDQLSNGVGYLYANAAANTLVSMQGILEPSNENKETTLSRQADVLPGFNLIGNPFPCNAYVDMDYQVISGDNFINGSGAIAPGTAVLVQASTDGETATFSRNEFAKRSKMDVEVSMNRGEVIDNARIRFGEGHDVNKFYMESGNTRLYIPKNGEDFAVVYAQSDEIPLNFIASQNGTYTISMSMEGIESDYLHLIDNMTGMDVDLLVTPTYTFEAKTSDYVSRFRLLFAPSLDQTLEGSESFAYNANGNWVISNEGKAVMQVVDMTGRILVSQAIEGNHTTRFDLSSGVYMLQLINGNEVRTQKIVVR